MKGKVMKLKLVIEKVKVNEYVGKRGPGSNGVAFCTDGDSPRTYEGMLEVTFPADQVSRYQQDDVIEVSVRRFLQFGGSVRVDTEGIEKLSPAGQLKVKTAS